jgi:secretion/DNA translocation related CpaE-like protein
MTISTVAVCCDDLGLMADARRLCATAGLDVEVAATLDVRRWWSSATAVLLDSAAAAQLTSGGLPRRPRVALLTREDDPGAWRLAVHLGAEQVAVLPLDEPALLRGVLSARTSAGGMPVVACIPASGGAGASTVAAGIGLAAARRGTETLLVDADAGGGGLDLMLGAEHAPGLRWGDVAALDPATPAEVILDGLLRPAPRLRLLSWGREEAGAEPPRAGWPMGDVTGAAGLGLVVLDMPRPTADATTPAVDLVLLVARAGVRQSVAAAAVATRLRRTCEDVRLVVRGASRGGLSATDVAIAVGLPLAAELPEDRRLPAAADDGQLARALARMPFDSIVESLVAFRARAA